MNAPNPVVAITSIMKSSDTAWLTSFRASMVTAKAPRIAAAVDDRLNELRDLALRGAIGEPLTDLTLEERVHESSRVYGAFVAHKQGGNRVDAAKIQAMVARWGEKEAVGRTVTKLAMSTGLELLLKYGRPDCAYEQIVLDFPGEYDAALVAKARENLARASLDS
jgi:hypothetical protein